MKKSCLLIGCLFIYASVLANQIEVCSNCEVKSIQAAVDLAEDGDEVLVRSGIYKEHNIEINKSIQLRGEGYPIVDGENKETIFKISADGFSVDGLEIINVGQSYTKDFAAILVSNSDGFVIQNNRFKKVFFGILVEKSKNGKIENNHISSEYTSQASSGNGIHLWHCSAMEVMKNEVVGLRDGIYFEFVKNSTVHDNVSFQNLRYGLHFMFSNENAYFNNVFEKNGAGVAIMFSKFVKMHHNRFVSNWGSASYGLLLKEIYDAEIENNVFDQNTIGISVDGSTRINYRHNTFERNGWAIKIIGACYEKQFYRKQLLK